MPRNHKKTKNHKELKMNDLYLLKSLWFKTLVV